jgi:hypothetical protein
MKTPPEGTKALLHSNKIVSKDFVCQFGLIQPLLISRTPYLFAVIVLNDDRLVGFGVSPEADVTIQPAALACGTLSVIALLAKWLPVLVIIASASGSRLPMVRRQFDVRFALATMSTSVVKVFFDFVPKRFARLNAGFSWRHNIKGNQLVFGPLLNDASKSFFALQLSHPPEWIAIGGFVLVFAGVVNQPTYFFFAYLWAWNPISLGPEPVQNQAIDFLEGFPRSYESFDRLSEPSCAGVRTLSWNDFGLQQQTLTCPGLTH